MSLLSWFSYVLKLFAASVKQLVDKSVNESEQRMKAVIAEQVKTQVAQYVQAAYAEGYAARVAEEGVFIDGQATNYQIPEATIAEVREMVQDKETYPDGPVIVKYTTEDE